MPDSAFFSEHSELMLGALLVTERQRAGLTQYVMAQKLGLSCSRLQAIESGNTRGTGFSPKLIRRTLALYAKKLGLGPSLANPYGSKQKPGWSLAFSQTPALLRHPAIAAGADCALLVAKHNTQPSPAEQ